MMNKQFYEQKKYRKHNRDINKIYLNCINEVDNTFFDNFKNFNMFEYGKSYTMEEIFKMEEING